MKPLLDETHDRSAKSWVDSANLASTDFPIQNLPFGVFRPQGNEPRVGVAIGDRILDVPGMLSAGLLANESVRDAAEACASGSLNRLMALGAGPRKALRRRLHALLLQDAPALNRHVTARHLVAQQDVEILLPATVGDYTDFYASIFHATNVGKLFRPENPLLPNYKYLPIGYHGRASSLVASGTPVRRPSGQIHEGAAAPCFAPTRALDYELELGFFVSAGNSLGEPVPIKEAEEHIFGVCLLNDWSARDVQSWEYQPLGPFLGKNFATTLSPWVVTLEALAPFRMAALRRAVDDPEPLPYLLSDSDQAHGGLDLWLEGSITSAQMRLSGIPPMVLGRSNARDLYWTLAQMLTHHASNGCNLRPGDLLATGTVSGADKGALGCLLELTWRGKESVLLPTGELRRFLEDGDEVILRGFCEREGFRRIGLGICQGLVGR
jgi:fumarylacetoacetase